MAKYQCVQTGFCARADKRECFEIDDNFKCSREPEDMECQGKLELVAEATRRRPKAGIIIAALLALTALASYFFMTPAGQPAQMSSKQPAKASPDQILKEVWPWLP